MINSSISDKPNGKLRTSEIKKLKTNLSNAVRGKEYEKASKIQAKIDDLEDFDFNSSEEELPEPKLSRSGRPIRPVFQSELF